MSSTQDELNKIFREVFNDNSLVISEEMTSASVDGWDSMSHVNLILAIEDKFNIKFSQKELMRQRNIGDLLMDIRTKFNS
ncbi:MAG: acyl carrier protein [Oligoflexia bacterium]|nr:acyl carrier protein [Oligoflexia bacterium]